MTRSLSVLVLLTLALLPGPRAAAQLPPSGLFSRTNLVAWCIVPFDARKRGPEERAAMLERLGIQRFAYDWRAEHLPTFDAEVAAMRKRGIELTAWWFPSELNPEANAILDCIRRTGIRPQLWVTMGTENEPDPVRLGEKLVGAVNTLAPLCAAAAKLGCTVGLYNHLGWFGEPANQVAILQRLRAAGHTNAGIVYNFHHGHAHIDRFADLLWVMQPYLLAVNLNGMVRGGDAAGRKIIPVATGDAELGMLRALHRSGWRGPVGILGHTDEDAEWKLQQELEGLERLVPLLDVPGATWTPAPTPTRTASTGNQAPAQPALLPLAAEPIARGRAGKALDARLRQLVTAGTLDIRNPPLTIEAWVRLGSDARFNILVASEAKSSPSHWELYTYAGDGTLSFFLPGAAPQEIRSDARICDGRWHHVAVHYTPNQVRLFVDGQRVAEQAIVQRHEAVRGAAQLAIGRLVEGGETCDGLIESVRISRGLRPETSLGRDALFADKDTLGIWTFESVNDLDGWAALAGTIPAVGTTQPIALANRAAPAPAVNREEPWKQTEGDWMDDRWNQTVPGAWQAYYFPAPSGAVRKGLAIRVGPTGDDTVLFDTALGQWRGAWTGGFLRFDPARFGLLKAPAAAGEFLLNFPDADAWSGGEFRWRGFAATTNALALEYTVGDVRVRESPGATRAHGLIIWSRELEFAPASTTSATLTLLPRMPGIPFEGEGARPRHRGFREGDRMVAVIVDAASEPLLARGPDGAVLLEVPPRGTTTRVRAYYATGGANVPAGLRYAAEYEVRIDSLAERVLGARGPRHEPIRVRGQLGTSSDPYVIDTIPVPYDNPDKSLLFCSGIGFFDNGDAAVATIHGDVWRVSGLDARLESVTWERIAEGLFQPLGLTVVSNQAVVLCRDHLTRLHDLNGDGSTDYYESLSSLIETSAGGHDYVTSLCRDDSGAYYYVDPRGAHRISADGRQLETLARGFRNPNGMGVSPDGRIITVAPQQGEWTPSSVIHEIRVGGWYGYPGPKVTPERPLGYDPPLCWIPHRIDNSSGSQVWAPASGFGPLSGHLLHLSWGRCTLLLTLRDEADGVAQGAVVPLKGRFLSGPMRGAFHPGDGHLYVVGSQGWQTAAARDGSLQRVRWTGKPLPLPVAWRPHEGALSITFNEPLDRETAEDPDSYALEAWNYRYAAQYGSKDWSASDPEREGHDTWAVPRARLLPDERTVVLEVPDLRPVMQFSLKFNVDTLRAGVAAGELYGTIHRLRPK